MALTSIELDWDVDARFTDRGDDVIVRVYDKSNPAVPVSITYTTTESPETVGPGDSPNSTKYITVISGLADDYEPGRAEMWINTAGDDVKDPTFRSIVQPLHPQITYLTAAALALTVTPPDEVTPDPDICTVTGHARRITSLYLAGAEITVRLLDGPGFVDDSLVNVQDETFLIGSDGTFSFDLLRGFSYRVTSAALGLSRRTIVVPAETATATLASLLQ